MKSKVLVILGPTATGKSNLAVILARKFNGEVISADSRQVYKGLNLGTGKITKKEMKGVRHHLLDVVSPRKVFTVSDYQKLAGHVVEQILAKGKLPIICGGTGLYIDSILSGQKFPEVPPNLKLRRQLERKTTAELFEQLKKLDPRRASQIDKNNPRRLIRAIEIARAIGKVPEFNFFGSKYNVLKIGLNLPAEKLKKRISIRLFARIREGMIGEATKLHRAGLSWKRMEDLGLEYRFQAKYLRGEISKEEMVKQLESAIWHYAKRQMTWFRRDKNIKWFEPKDSSRIVQTVRKFILAE
ncbi:MAG: tRNA (adenosine(37)-N6)-dimethylallyltransferase MiaA [Candidatus Paceibacterota bacterium]|jgi:tRNA dimethylallyltransferase